MQLFYNRILTLSILLGIFGTTLFDLVSVLSYLPQSIIGGGAGEFDYLASLCF